MSLIVRRKTLILFFTGLFGLFLIGYGYYKGVENSSPSMNQENMIEGTTAPVEGNGSNLSEITEEMTDREESQNLVRKENFYTEYRLERERVRGQQMEILREIINHPTADEEIKKRAQNDLLDITEIMKKESQLENLIKAKNFEDAVVFIDDNLVKVVVPGDSLSEEQIASITDLIAKGTGIQVQNIIIIPKK